MYDIKRLAQKIAYRFGLYLGYTTPEEKVIELISSLCPRRVELKRFGPAGDGGYLMPDDLEDVVACISPGVSTECGFDLDMAERGLDVFMADASIDRVPADNPRLHFKKLFFDTYSSDNTVTIDDFCRSAPSGDLILQMDIEGAEYRIIENMSEALLRRFRIMVIEFHGVNQIFDAQCFDRLRSVFNRLGAYHEVVHAHPNNYYPSVRLGGIDVPPLMELTFYRRDRMPHKASSDIARIYPHPLDVDCVPGNPPIVLPKCWHAG